MPTKTSTRTVTAYPDVYQEESAYLFSLLKDSSLGVGLFVRQEEFVFCNQVLSQSLRMENIVLEHCYLVNLYQNREEFQGHMTELFQGNSVHDRQTALRRSDGTWRGSSLPLKKITGPVTSASCSRPTFRRFDR